MTVLVVHPGLQHSYQMAWALYEKRLLQGFWSGVPIQSDGAVFDSVLPPRWARKLKKVAIPGKLCRHPVQFPVLYRAAGMLSRWIESSDIGHRLDHRFDAWVAGQIHIVRPRAIVAYENAARDTFRVAKAQGIRCILDAASLHHETAAKLNPTRPTPYLAEINRRKDEEVGLADLILTCSDLAAESYRAAGVAASRLCSLPLGAALPIEVSNWARHEEPLHFVFAGALSQRKSIDLILAAFRELYKSGLRYRVSFVGGEGEAGWIEKIRQTPNSTYFPTMAQRDLFLLLGKADCLLLPSRYDSFGMVVAEAMACGTPAIVSYNTGAKVMIETIPGAGWVVDCTAESLLQCLRARIQDRQSVFSARPFALKAAEQFTWQAYRGRAGKTIEQWLM